MRVEIYEEDTLVGQLDLDFKDVGLFLSLADMGGLKIKDKNYFFHDHEISLVENEATDYELTSLVCKIQAQAIDPEVMKAITANRQAQFKEEVEAMTKK